MRSRGLLACMALLISVAIAGCGSSGGGGAAASCRALVPDTGTAAADFITDGVYDRLEVEVDFLDGPPADPDRYLPEPEALAYLADRLAARVRKPAGVTVTADDRIPRGEALGRYRLSDLEALEARHRDALSGDVPGVAVLYVLWLDGPAAIDRDLLGLNFAATSVAIFDETLRGVASLAEDRRRALKMLLLHEAGHALGLVDLGTLPTSGHVSRSSPCHDRSAACVMFPRIETSVLGSVNDPPLDLDRACQEDIEAAGGNPPD